MAFIKLQRDKNSTDNELVSRFRLSHNSDYVGELFQRYTHLVFGVCMKYLQNEEHSKDAVMEIFEKLLIDLKKHDVDNFKSWLYSVAKNHCLMKLRKDKSQANHVDEFGKDSLVLMENEEPLHHTNGEEQELLDKSLYEGIEHLKEEQKVCVELFYLQSKSYEEVAEVTGYSMMQVKSYIQNGKRNLKIFLTEKRRSP
jgi:RNA polymerase sigma-70 factor (ECF subfamily)